MFHTADIRLLIFFGDEVGDFFFPPILDTIGFRCFGGASSSEAEEEEEVVSEARDFL